MKKNLFAIDCSTSVTHLALSTEAGYEEESIETHPPGDHLLCAAEALLKRNHESLNSLKAIVYGQGPGSFTGIRMAVCVAQALCAVLKIPAVGISTLETMAHSAHRLYGCKNMAVMLDARMKEVYWGLYSFCEKEKRIKPLEKDQVKKPQDLYLPPEQHWEVVSYGCDIDSLEIPKEILQLPFYPLESIYLLDMIEIAQKKMERGEVVNTFPLPVYVRNEVAHKKVQ